MDKASSANSERESRSSSWLRVLKIAGDEFQQSALVAQLAVKLCELEYTRSQIVKQPDDYLLEAWELIQKARAHVKRPADQPPRFLLLTRWLQQTHRLCGEVRRLPFTCFESALK